MNRLWALLIILDQLLNVLFGSGWSNETLSSFFYRLKRDENRPFWCNLTDGIFFWQTEHCFNSYLRVKKNMYAPPEARGRLKWLRREKEYGHNSKA